MNIKNLAIIIIVFFNVLSLYNICNFTDALTLIAVLVALFGERVWKYIDKKKIKNEINKIVIINLNNLKIDLEEIIEGEDDPSKDIYILGHKINRINGYYFLFSELLLSNLIEIELSNYLKTIDFFAEYKIGISNLQERLIKFDGKKGFLKLETIKNLISKLDESIDELKGKK